MTTMFVPRILAELPDGWGALDAAEFFGPAGARVRVTAEILADGLDTAGLAELHGRLLSENTAGYHETDAQPVVAFGGQPAIRRQFTFGEDDSPFGGIAVYMVVGGVSYIASASGPADRSSSMVGEVDSVTEWLTLLGTPLVPNGHAPATNGSSSANGLARPPLVASDWADARRRWAKPGSVDSGESSADLVLSAEELLVVAAMLGAGAFPTVAPHALAALPGAERAAVGQALVRSLVTREVLRTDDDGVVVADPARPLLEAAVYPDLMVEITRVEADHRSTVAFCVRTDAMVVVAGDGVFGRRVGAADPAELVDRIIEFSGLGSAIPGEGSPRQASADDFDRSVVVRSTWRDAAALVGGELHWVIDGDGRSYAAEARGASHPTTLDLRPVSLDDVRAEILEHLPGI